jgi:hypothetical protein
MKEISTKNGGIVGTSLQAVISTRFQNGEGAWMFLAPTGIDPIGQRPLLRWSWEGSMLRQEVP